jgi:hypothetical protein
LEVLTPFPSFLQTVWILGSSDPNAHVLENVAPLATGRGKVKKTTTRKCASTATSSTAVSSAKRPKASGSKPPRRDKNTAPRTYVLRVSTLVASLLLSLC